MGLRKRRRVLTGRRVFVPLAAGWIVALCGTAASAQCSTLLAPVEIASGWQLQDSAKVPDVGAAVSTKSYQPTAWVAATVPGTVLTSMVNNGIYPEPLYGENNRETVIPESLNKTSYWYRTVV